MEMIEQQEDAFDPQSFGSFFELEQARERYLKQIEDEEHREAIEALTDRGALLQAYTALQKVDVRRVAVQGEAEKSGDFSEIV